MKILQYGLNVWTVEPHDTHPAHYHNDVELIYVASGQLSYLYRADSITLNTGALILFWAAVPHQLQQIIEDSLLYIITIPLEIFVQWDLNLQFVDHLMNGHPLIQTDTHTKLRLAEEYFRQWQHDLHMASSERRDIVLLELQALIKRLSLYAKHTEQLTLSAKFSSSNSIREVYAHQMADFIAHHYHEPITLNDIAHTVDIHPSYASTVFSDVLNVTIWDFLTQYRIAHAQRLLLLTNMEIDAIADASGFTSISQFYAVFKKLCHQSPKKFRTSAKSHQSNPR